jgi:acyl dehydratase
MRSEAKGQILADEEVTVHEDIIAALTRALDTSSARATATLVPFFGATLGGEALVIDGLELDLSRSMLAGLGYEWTRPFQVGETVRARISIEDVYTKGNNQFGVVIAEFTDTDGGTVQRQSITFIERNQQQ